MSLASTNANIAPASCTRARHPRLRPRPAHSSSTVRRTPTRAARSRTAARRDPPTAPARAPPTRDRRRNRHQRRREQLATSTLRTPAAVHVRSSITARSTCPKRTASRLCSPSRSSISNSTPETAPAARSSAETPAARRSETTPPAPARRLSLQRQQRRLRLVQRLEDPMLRSASTPPRPSTARPAGALDQLHAASRARAPTAAVRPPTASATTRRRPPRSSPAAPARAARAAATR